MSNTGLAVFDTTVQKTNLLLKEVMEELHLDDLEDAYRCLRAVLHALRDRLIVEEAAKFGAQLPMLVRGFYFEGWRPGGKPLKERHLAQFIERIQEGLVGIPAQDPARIARGVFLVLNRHVAAGEIDDVRQGLPAEIRTLWPDPGQECEQV